MDLLVLPEDPAFPIEDAPFVCDQNWDCGTFITYPVRTNQLHAIPPRFQTDYPELSRSVAYEWRVGGSNHENIFQMWLFFGLMAEFLALNEREDGSRVVKLETAKQEMAQLMQDCVRDAGDSKILLGRPFLSLRSKILDRFLQEVSADRKALRARHMSRCLNFAREMVRFADMGLRESVRHSVAALGQILVYMLRNMCRAAGLNITLEKGFWTTWAMSLLHTNASLWTQMSRVGWCPGDLERFKQTAGYLSCMHYAGRLKLPPSRYNHESCTSKGCLAAQIHPPTYELMHVDDGCACKTLGPDQDEINSVLFSGKDTYPVLHFVRGSSSSLIDVKVESHRADVPFVAISHVWADGLGNPFANVLQSCQLLRLAKLAASLDQPNDNDARLGYRVWLDTLCCPIAEAGKKVALERMASVYRDAAHVLVLDAALESLRFDRLSGPEKYIRVFTSTSWVKRLWTFQEGALDSSLFFQFAERAVNITELKDLLRKHDLEDDLGSLCQNALEMFDSLQMRVGRHPDDPMPERPLLSRRLGQLQRGIRYRSVSVPSDEALCIATLLGLDPQRVLESDQPGDRIKTVWSLASEAYGGFPAESVFFMGYDTLGAPGWRWAPRTLLNSGSDVTWSNQDRHMGFMCYQMGAVVPQGLEVCFPGQLVRLHSWAPELRVDTWEHLASRPNYPIIARKAASKQLVHMMLDLHGLPETLPDMSIRHVLGCSGQFVVLRSTDLPTPRHLLGQTRCPNPSENTSEKTDPIPLEFMVHVRFSELPEAGQIFYENVIYLAKKAALHDSSIRLSEAYDRDSSIGTQASEEVRQYMKSITAQRVEENEEFRQIALRFLDKGESLETLWEAIPITCPFEIELQHFPEDQRWIID